MKKCRAQVNFIDKVRGGVVARTVETDDPRGGDVRFVGEPTDVVPYRSGDDARGNENKDDCTGCGKLKLDAKALASGAKALSKIKFGKDKAADEIVAARIAVCVACPSKCHDGFGVCDLDRGGCGCLLPIKVRIASESCPHNHWAASSS